MVALLAFATLAMTAVRTIATLEQVRFAEFLLARSLITEEQWLAALADHWSSWSSPDRRSIGATIVAHGYLAEATVEAEARVFHDALDVVEVG